ncbi:hypothetical protein ACVME8_009282 [Bradyrhizobium diazoefficiens]
MQLLKGNLEHAVTTTILTMTLSLVWGAVLTIVITLVAQGARGLAFTSSRASSAAVTSIGRPLRSTRAWISAPRSADVQSTASACASRPWTPCGRRSSVN